jgi:hypothetical protein
MSSFKLEQQAEGENTIISLQGDLVGEYVSLVQSYLEQFFPAKSKLILKLRDMHAIGPPGVELLQRLADKGVALVGAGVYTEFLIEKITSRSKSQ